MSSEWLDNMSQKFPPYQCMLFPEALFMFPLVTQFQEHMAILTKYIWCLAALRPVPWGEANIARIPSTALCQRLTWTSHPLYVPCTECTKSPLQLFPPGSFISQPATLNSPSTCAINFSVPSFPPSNSLWQYCLKCVGDFFFLCAYSPSN